MVLSAACALAISIGVGCSKAPAGEHAADQGAGEAVQAQTPTPAAEPLVGANNGAGRLAPHEIAASDGHAIVRSGKDATAALLLINHINCAVTRIKNANDAFVLEEEYNSINQNAILLDAIKDEEMISLICDIMDAIVELRINEREREFLQEELEQGLSDALYDAMPNPATLISGNPIACLCSFAAAAATSYMNYKKAKASLMRQFKKANWELDKDKMHDLNELNKRLLEKYWIIVDRYKIKDCYRVVEGDVAHLIDRMKDTDPRRRRDFLRDYEEKYRFLPAYWYHRGVAEMACGDANSAIKAFSVYQGYQKDFVKVMRYDKMSANVAMLALRVMLEQEEEGVRKYSDAEIAQQLDILDKNSTKDDWSNYYFCAIVHWKRLKDAEKAKTLLQRVIDELECERDNNLVDWKEFVRAKWEVGEGDAGTAKELNGNDALFDCKSLMTQIAFDAMSEEESKKKLDEICTSATAAAREKLFCYCSMDYKGALKHLEKDIKGMVFCLKEELIDGKTIVSIDVEMPISWIAGREGDMKIYCCGNEGACMEGLNGNSSAETMFVEDKNERRVVESRDCDGNPADKVKLKFKPKNGSAPDLKDVKFARFVIRYDRGSSQKAFQVAVMTELKREVSTQPKYEAFGAWNKRQGGATDGTASTWGEGYVSKQIVCD